LSSSVYLFLNTLIDDDDDDDENQIKTKTNSFVDKTKITLFIIRVPVDESWWLHPVLTCRQSTSLWMTWLVRQLTSIFWPDGDRSDKSV